MIRAFFVLAPSLAMGLWFFGIAVFVGLPATDGLIVAVPIFFIYCGVGWSATRPRADRGEGSQ